jgi:spore maturation protein CgeB
LSRLGHEVTFAEPDIYNRQQNRDCSEIDYATVRVYETPRELHKMLSEACDSDLIIKHSGVGADDGLLEAEVLRCGSDASRVAFWDVDAPATLARVGQNRRDPFRELIPKYDFVFTYGGGDPVVEQYTALGAQNCIPIYNALDPDTHHPVAPDQKFECDLAFVGNRLPDREARVEQFFLAAAERAPEFNFLLGGEGWGSRSLPANVRWIGHVGTGLHNVINCSARMVLNINRELMARTGFSPPTRVFEAAGAAACLITDAWTGVEHFFEPGREILVAHGADEIVSYLREISPADAHGIGSAMHRRALRDHVYESRAKLVDKILESAPTKKRSAPLVESAA